MLLKEQLRTAGARVYLSLVPVCTMDLHHTLAPGRELTPKCPAALATRGLCLAEVASAPSAF